MNWPPLPEPYDGALRDAVALIFEETDPQAIIASGTIIRGNPDATSDLDLFVIHERPVRRRLQKSFRGVPAEIFFNPANQVREYFKGENRSGHPSASHIIATGTVVYSEGTIADELRAEALEWLERPLANTDDDLVRARYFAATRLEDGADVVDKDPATSALFLTQAVSAMMEFFFLSKRIAAPRNKELLTAIARTDRTLGNLIEEFFRTPSPAKRLDLANTIADRTIGVRGFFEWDSGWEDVKL